MISPDFLPLRSGARLFSYGFAKRLQENYDLHLVAGYIKKTTKKEIDHMGNEFKDISLFCIDDKLLFDFIKRIYIALSFSIVSGYYYRRSALRKIREIIKEKDIKSIVFDNSASLWYYKKIRKEFPDIKRIYNSHNAESRNMSELIASSGGIKRMFHKLEYRHSMKYEKMVLEDDNVILAIARQDALYYENIFSIKRDIILNTPKIDFSQVKDEGDIMDFKHRLLFVGSMFWYPNVSGIKWFINNVFRELIRENPGYKLYIVGQKAERGVLEAVCRGLSDNIVITGSVPSVDEYYKTCDIAVVPIYEGAGAKIKVLEALAKGIPSVISTYCAKDYDLSDEAILAEKAEDYIEYIKKLSKDPSLRIQLHKKGKKYYNDSMVLSEDIKKAIEGIR